MSAIETATRTVQTPPARGTARATRTVSHGAGFWLVGYAFTVVMAFAAVPTPLYVLYAQRDHLSSTLITCVFAAYAVGVVISLFTIGHISDWVGRRRMLLVALVLALAAGAVFIVWTSLVALLIARVVSGLAVGIVTTTATAHLAELHALHRPDATARRAQVVAVAANLGGIGLGPLMAGLLAQFAPDPLHVPYLVTEALLAIALVALVLTPETVWRTGPVRYRMQRIAVPREARAAFAAAALGAAVVFTVLGMFSALVPSFLAGALHDPSHALAGAVASVVFLASAVAQLAGRSTRGNPLKRAVPFTVAGLTALAVGTWTAQLPVFVAGAVATGVGVGMVFKTLLAAVVT
ncbi:MAG TPA: MFS transporter, partial [Mycobacteriales bacterium]|nr:MFS transporter [Mycobacteriales bacterium]